MKKILFFILITLFLSTNIFAVDADKKKISELTESTSITDDDLLIMVDSPSTTPTTKRINYGNFKTSTFTGANSVATLSSDNSLTADGTFTTNSGWTVGSGWVISGGVASHSAGDVQTLEGTTSSVSGNYYVLTFTLTRSAGSITLYLGDNITLGGTTYSSSYTYIIYIRASGDSVNFKVVPTNTFIGTIDNITLNRIIPSSSIISFVPSDNSLGSLDIRTDYTNNNLFIGKDSGSNSYNIYLGTTSTGNFNVGIGYQSLYKNFYGYRNIGIGYQSLYELTIGAYNTAIGYYAGKNTTSGSGNLFLGQSTGVNNTTGYYNSFIGSTSGESNTTGNYNFFMGAYSGRNNTTGNYNFFMGAFSGYVSTTGSYNNMIGLYSGYNLTSGNYNTFLGHSAGKTVQSGNYNTFIGVAATQYYYKDLASTLSITMSSGGEIDSGFQSYYLTFILDGLETTLDVGTSQGIPISSSSTNRTANLSNIPTYTGPLTCTGRKLYRSITSSTGVASYYLVADLNDNTTTTATDTMSNATLATQTQYTSSSHLAPAIGIGYKAETFAPNQLVIGSHDAPITDIYIGKGVYPSSNSTTISNLTINASGGYGTDKAGGNISIAGGKSTGAGTPGTVSIKTSSVGSSGVAGNALVERVKVDHLAVTNYIPTTIKGTVGGYTRKFSEATATLSGASTTIQTNVPASSRILAVQLRVDTAITSGDGALTWDATFSGGSTTAITAEQAFTKNTKANIMLSDIVSTSETDILITPSSGTFSGGLIRAIVYYETLEVMDDAS